MRALIFSNAFLRWAIFLAVLLITGCEGAESEDDPDGNGDDKPAQTNAIMLYKFEENSGTSALNSASNSYHGTIFAASRTTGIIGNALNFSLQNGAHVHINVGSRSIAFNNDSITIACWLRPVSSFTSGSNYVIIGGPINDAQSLAFRINGTGNLEFLLSIHGGNPDVSVISSNTPPLINNMWTHVAAVYDGNNARLYINGVEIISSSITMPIGNIISDFYLGGMPPPEDEAVDTPLSFPGLIDEMIIFDTALNSTEIQDLVP